MRQRNIASALFQVLVAATLVLGSLTAELPIASMAGDSQAQAEPTPEQVLAKAAFYLKNLQQFSFDAEITEDEAFEGGIAVQSVHSMSYYVKRPDRLRFRMQGDDRDKEWFYDGKMITAYDHQKNFYSREAFPPTIDAALTKAREELNLRPSIVGLARTDLFEALTQNVDKLRLVGLSRVNGIPCYQLFLERERVNAQIWIQTGDIPLFRKILLTYKQEEGVPQWSATFFQWNTSPDIKDKMFEFAPPPGSVQIKFLKRSVLPSP